MEFGDARVRPRTSKFSGIHFPGNTLGILTLASAKYIFQSAKTAGALIGPKERASILSCFEYIPFVLSLSKCRESRGRAVAAPG